MQAADDPTAGVQRQALGVEVDANEVPRAAGKFKNEAYDRYAVVLELALSDYPAEALWVTCRILVEVRYRHHSVAGGIELQRWFCLGGTNATSNERGKSTIDVQSLSATFASAILPGVAGARLNCSSRFFNGFLLNHGCDGADVLLTHQGT